MIRGDPLTECCAEAVALADDGPADPDRSWAHRDSGHGDESCDDEDGPIDTLASYQRFCDYWRNRR